MNLSRNGQLVFSFILDLDPLHRELCVSLKLPEMQRELELGLDLVKRSP